jgi:hypothetical protein
MLGDLILSLIRLGEEADNPTKESLEGLQLGIRDGGIETKLSKSHGEPRIEDVKQGGDKSRSKGPVELIRESILSRGGSPACPLEGCMKLDRSDVAVTVRALGAADKSIWKPKGEGAQDLLLCHHVHRPRCEQALEVL